MIRAGQQDDSAVLRHSYGHWEARAVCYLARGRARGHKQLFLTAVMFFFRTKASEDLTKVTFFFFNSERFGPKSTQSSVPYGLI